MVQKLSKQEYFAKLRKNWDLAKKASETNEFKAMYAEAKRLGVQVSRTGFVFTKMQMQEAGLEGTPYIDTKTYKGWRDSGFTVKKGEKSRIKGMTFIKVDEEDIDSFMYPKSYSLFHASQVEAI